MGVAQTGNFALNKADKGTRDWHNYLNQNFDLLDTELKRQKDKDGDIEAQVNNIVSQAGSDNTEIVDSRLGADGVARATLGTLIREIHKQKIDGDKHEELLSKPLQAVRTDVATPFNVLYTGKTRFNLIRDRGSKGNLDKHWSYISSYNGMVYADYLELNKVSGNGATDVYLKRGTAPIVDKTKYYVVGYTITRVDGTVSKFTYNSKWDNIIGTNYSSRVSKGRHVIPAPIVNSGEFNFQIYNLDGPDADLSMRITDVDIFEVTQAEYDEVVNEDVWYKYPHAEGLTPTKNPYAIVRGRNLVPPFTHWSVLTNNHTVQIKSPTEVYCENPTLAGHWFREYIEIEPNVRYTITGEATSGGGMYYYACDKDKARITSSINAPNSYVAPSNAKYLEVIIHTFSNSNVTWKNYQIEAGNEVGEYNPFTPFNEDVEIVEAELFDGDFVYELDGSYYKKNDKAHAVVNGTDISWSYGGQKSTTYKEFYCSRGHFPNMYDSSYNQPMENRMVRHDGLELTNIIGSSSINAPNQFAYASVSFTVAVADVDSGLGVFSDTLPSSDFMKGYFNGWKYTGDGTTHTWASIVDGTNAPTQTKEYVSTNLAPNYSPHELVYKVQTKQQVAVNGEFGLSLQEGVNIVEVGDGGVVRELANPYHHSTNGKYYINAGSNSALTKEMIEKVVHVYKNGEIDEGWEIVYDSSNGHFAVQIRADLFDTNATYEISYIPMNKKGTWFKELQAFFNSSQKSVLDETVKDVSDLRQLVSGVEYRKASKHQEAWIRPTYLNSWGNVGNGTNGIDFMKDELGFVHLKGYATGGANGTVIFTLPKGYRPFYEINVYTGADNGTSLDLVRLQVQPTGEVKVAKGYTSGNLTIDGIIFRAEQ